MMRLVLGVILLAALLPMSVASQTTMTIKIYYANSKRSGVDCGEKVFPVQRVVPKTPAVARAALEQLFAGPTAEEQAKGYESWFSAQTASILKGLKIVKGTAYVNFTEMRELLGNASTSCGSGIFLAEIEATLKQFPNVKKIVYAIEGDPAEFYEWMQVGCEENPDCNKARFRT